MAMWLAHDLPSLPGFLRLLEKEEFEKVFWGLLEQKQTEKQNQNNKTGRKRSAAWTLFSTWLSELALSKGSSGHCPHMSARRLRYFTPSHLLLPAVSALVSVVRAHGPEWLVLTGLASSADLEIAECLT